MKVENLMTRSPKTCAPDSTLADAVLAMAEARCGVLPVVELGKVVGMLTDRDACIALAREDGRPSEVLVESAMSRDLHYVKPDDTHSRALQLMRRWRVRRLPVLSSDGTLRGIVAIDDLALQATSSGEDRPSWADLVATFQAICERQRLAPPRTPGTEVERLIGY
jgi:CBS domain-containing protein